MFRRSIIADAALSPRLKHAPPLHSIRTIRLICDFSRFKVKLHQLQQLIFNMSDTFNVLLLGAGPVNFGTTEGPWNHVSQYAQVIS
jgi:hypothetical protein